MISIDTARREIRPWNLNGISENQIAQHWALYEGYVKNAEALRERLAALSNIDLFGPEFTELKRRWGYEANGVILHENYFEALKSGGKTPGDATGIAKLIKESFGGFGVWMKEFCAVGNIRGTGWAILYLDPKTATLSNVWIASHECGHLAGCVPLLVMDVWEHAYMVDWGASGRSDYIDSFFKNVDWKIVDGRLHRALGVRGQCL